MHKCAVLVLITCLVVSSLIAFTVTPVTAQAGYKPSVPQISNVKSVDSSYDVPSSSTTTVDQYTGKETTTTISGYHVNQKSIEITIKNQPFKPYTNKNNGQEINLYYLVQVKGRFGEDWKSFGGDACTVQSNSGHTVVTGVSTYDARSQLDFKVQAAIGYLPIFEDGMLGYYGAIGCFDIMADARSDWSSIRAFTVPEDHLASVLPSQTVTLPPVTSDGNDPSQFPGQIQPSDFTFTNPLFLVGVGTLLGGVVVVVVMVILRRHLKTLTYTNNPTQTNTYTE
jgi:hypothetical protein